MKRMTAVLLSLLLVLSVGLTACGSKPNDEQDDPGLVDPIDDGEEGNQGGETTEPDEGNVSVGELDGSALDVLGGLLADTDVDFGATFEDPVTADTAQSYLGLSEDQFNQYVDEAYYSTGAMTTNAHLVAIIKCNDAADAAAVKELVAAGFDSGRWICVAPEESFAVEAENYVLLASTTEEGATMLKDAFAQMAGGSLGQVNVFYTGR